MGPGTSVRYSSPLHFYPGAANFAGDPRSANLDEPNNRPGKQADDQGLAATSLCIDAGLDTTLPPGVLTN